MLDLKKSEKAFALAKKYIPGGVNSPVRSFRDVGGTPPFISSAQGSRMYDIDGNEYIDYVLSWGPMILGHAHPAVIAALQEALPRGTSYGAPTVLEVLMAEKIHNFMPSIEVIRMVNSGTEATMSALRLARAYTKRDKIIKFIGCYHGHSDGLLVKGGSGLATFGIPDSPGVPADITKNTIAIPYNDIIALEKVFTNMGDEIAAVIIEPVAGNMGLVLPKDGYLFKLRQVTEKYGALLIFDEVMCGFRASCGGAQKYYHVTPDLTCLGKIIGGGLPVGAFGGRRDIMNMISPAGAVYQAGTLSGNPLAMTAGLATLSELQQNVTLFPKLEEMTKLLCDGLQLEAERIGLHLQHHRIGSMFSVFFSDKPVQDFDSASKSDSQAFRIFFKTMLENGIYLPPSQFECCFLSTAHTKKDVKHTIELSAKAFSEVARYKEMINP